MLRAHTYLLFGLISAYNVSSQPLSLADLQGSWYFHQYFLDSALIADADRPTRFPQPHFDLLKQLAASNGLQFPDSATVYQMAQQNDENYRHYRIDFNSDSTYLTELAAGMAKWLPVNGQVRRTSPDGTLQLFDAVGTTITSAIRVDAGELHLILADPMFFGPDTPTMHSELVFRRKEP